MVFTVPSMLVNRLLLGRFFFCGRLFNLPFSTVPFSDSPIASAAVGPLRRSFADPVAFRFSLARGSLFTF